ncbi:MAG: alanyl-tRNA editing protein [Bryobacteraceae bacterium]|nr:alanyl-tRNA editing protein [Bryobacteraceae bacterium]
MTERLYYNDSSLLTFDAQVLEVAEDGRRVYLDRTAFYPTSGGQPFDTGTLGGVAVTDVVDEESRVAHLLAGPLSAGMSVAGKVDWPRRQDHMQQHTGQHLLSAVLHDLCGCATLSFHLGNESCTIDIAAPSLTAEQIAATERRVNELIRECRPVTVSYEDADEAAGLRKASRREGTLRIVSIEGIDRSACGGTHVSSTGAIGCLQIRRLDKIRGNLRIEFLCGRRATERARRDFDALSAIARAFSAPVDDTPALVKAQMERLQEAEKSRKKLAAEVAGYEGRRLFEETAASADGVRRVLRRAARGAADDELRILAQAFTAGGKAVFLALFEDPPAILLAASRDSGVNAGEVLKATLAANGGRGGGNAQLAQGTVASRPALEAVLTQIETTAWR